MPGLFEQLGARADGPLSLRLVLQPTIASLIAIRSAWKDARAGAAPFFWAVLSSPDHRRELLRHGWKDVGKVFVLATVLDLVYQWIVVRSVRPGQALVVAALLALFPYLLMRGPANRLLLRRSR
jgi:hypothetical protein